MKQTALIFAQFLWRDFYIFLRRVKSYGINYMILYPTAFSIAFGYFLPNGSFGASVTPEQVTIVFVGSMLLFLQVTGFILNLELIRDLEGDKFINYQMTILDGRLVIIERILFVSLFSFMLAIPYYPISKLILGTRFVTAQVSWPAVYLMQFLGALLCGSLNVWAFCFLKGGSRALPKFWLRVYNPMIILGGFVVPWAGSYAFSPLLGYLLLADPMIYITEGLRQAFLHKTSYFSLPICIGALLCFTTAFCISTVMLFKRKVDHI